MKNIIPFLFLIVGLSVTAQPIQRTSWTTNAANVATLDSSGNIAADSVNVGGSQFVLDNGGNGVFEGTLNGPTFMGESFVGGTFSGDGSGLTGIISANPIFTVLSTDPTTNALTITGDVFDNANGTYNWGGTGYILEPNYSENLLFSNTPVPHWVLYDSGVIAPIYTNNSADVTTGWENADGSPFPSLAVSLAVPEPIVLNPSHITAFLIQADAFLMQNGMKIYSVAAGGGTVYMVHRITPDINFIAQNDTGQAVPTLQLVAANRNLSANIPMEISATSLLLNAPTVQLNSGGSFSAGNISSIGGHFTGNGSGITNATASYFTNLVNGATNKNTQTRTVQWTIPVVVSSPATTLGSAEIDAQIQRADGVWITVADCDIAGGATSIISTNKESLVVTVPSGASMRVTNNVSGTGYVAGLDATKTNTFTVFP